MARELFVHVAPPHPASIDEATLLSQCEQARGRSSGPGGQHRNKVETKALLVHEPTGTEAHAGERRSLGQNQREAVFRLRLALATRVRCPVPTGEIRTALWRTRVDSRGHVACNPAHDDYPTLLALALDVLHAASWDARKAAARLVCSPSQLLKLVKDHPAAWGVLNEAREALGKHKLK